MAFRNGQKHTCGFPGGLVVKNPPANARDAEMGFDPWVGKIPWKREWLLIQYSCLENFMDKRASGLVSMGHKESDMTE